ncbi:MULTISPECIES: class I SAM-dependent methyltransferase [Agrobacterium]|uniref:class I SAM-dependent methyltransferase n=1 Tax=Agrobacterium TaxID=357 RepID=UPI001C2274F4|nr:MULTISPECIES: class I SAM-dependent methyltransferase [Agrobacterium]MDA5639327.1 class I SAM-dependent methyltransferase [Agrobacterium sp. ST15.13.013]MDA6999198.1 class I SAM-dependent methyltransferase [Agrobacterium salinitolerans]QXC52850.1 class I SAM-dependent methyltransferase [Agrobacterium salinitolerans]
MRDNPNPFLTPAAVSDYVRDTPRKVPGLADLHKMATLLLAEQAPRAADVLVVGAGGGLEIRAMAEMRPDWRFTGVDPSPAMLDIARQTTSPCAERTHLIRGTAADAPAGPFDGAVCLLTLHFLDWRERLETLQEVRRRLKPGGVFVAAHHTEINGQAHLWLLRSAAFAAGLNAEPGQAAASAKAMAERLPLLSQDREEACFRGAGFRQPSLFYAALSFRGWVMTA